MDVLVSGSGGMIASNLMPRLRERGHRVVPLVRRQAREPDTVSWDVEDGTVDVAGLEGLDAIVHLAGRPIPLRLTKRARAEVFESRVRGTRILAEAVAGLQRKPKVMVSASAIGYYGPRGEEELTEQSAAGDTFLANLCREWEAATTPAREAGVRVCCIRTGLVLTADAGLLKPMLLPFKLGLGGPLGSGRQYMSWISIDDEVAAIVHLLEHDVSGPVNLTAPNPVRNAEFTKALGRALHRPTVLPVPAFALRLALGREMGAEAVASLRVLPSKLEQAGYRFRHTALEDALGDVLGR